MRRFNRIMALALSTVMAFSSAPALTALAANKTLAAETVYMTSKKGGYYNFEVDKITEMSKPVSSKTKVLKPYSFTIYQNSSKRSSVYDSWEPSESTDTYAAISCNLYKQGTAKVSFTAGKDKYTKTVKVKSYVNPLKHLKISNVQKGRNLATKFNTTNDVKFYGKKADEVQIMVQSSDGWEIKEVYINNTSYTSVRRGNRWYETNEVGTSAYRYYKSGTTRCELDAENYDNSIPSTVHVKLQNTATKGTLSIYARINEKEIP